MDICIHDFICRNCSQPVRDVDCVGNVSICPKCEDSGYNVFSIKGVEKLTNDVINHIKKTIPTVKGGKS